MTNTYQLRMDLDMILGEAKVLKSTLFSIDTACGCPAHDSRAYADAVHGTVCRAHKLVEMLEETLMKLPEGDI